jgi:hypothetical protein
MNAAAVPIIFGYSTSASIPSGTTRIERHPIPRSVHPPKRPKILLLQSRSRPRAIEHMIQPPGFGHSWHGKG